MQLILVLVVACVSGGLSRPDPETILSKVLRNQGTCEARVATQLARETGRRLKSCERQTKRDAGETPRILKSSDLKRMLAPQGPLADAKRVPKPRNAPSGKRCRKARRAHALLCDLYGKNSDWCTQSAVETMDSACQESEKQPTILSAHV